MNSRADLLLAACVLAACVPVLLPSRLPAPHAVPRDVEGRVAAVIAATWHVPPDRIALSWGTLRGVSRLETTTPFRLQGMGQGGWFIVVFQPLGRPAVAVRLQAGTRDTVTVSTHALPRGARLDSEDIGQRAVLHWGPPDSAAGAAPGWVVQRPLAAGEVLARPAVTPPPLVVAGWPVHVVWTAGAVRISIDGVALRAAALGDAVEARLVGRAGSLWGRVVGPGIVAMDPTP
jgi:flagella basal body P-ring formation protein FlgA